MPKVKEFISWNQIAVVIAFLVFAVSLAVSLGAVLKDKADKKELCRVEEQSIARDVVIKKDFQRTIDRIDRTMKENNEMLMKLIERH